MAIPLQNKPMSEGKVTRITYTHDAIIDKILTNPTISLKELSVEFGYSATWLSVITGSDAFNARLAERRGELIDPFVVESVENRLRGLVNQSIELVANRIERNPGFIKTEDAVKAIEVCSKALGFGARHNGTPTVAIQNVIVVPAKEATAEDWTKQYGPKEVAL